jgi:hypothetical protein
MTAIVIVVVSVVGYFSARKTNSTKSKTAENHPLSIEELGVQVQPGASEEAEVSPDGGRGWAYWTGGGGAAPRIGTGMGVANGKRVGEAEDER